MSTSRLTLEQECQAFTRYLTGKAPTPYVVEKYCDAHAAGLGLDGDDFDDRLTAAARKSPHVAFIADAYARFFAKRGALRKKLVALLAILETAPPYFLEFDRPLPGGIAAQALGLAARFLLFILALVVGIVVFHPMRLFSSGRRTRPIAAALRMKEEGVSGPNGGDR